MICQVWADCCGEKSGRTHRHSLYSSISISMYVAQTQSLFGACCLRTLLHLRHYLAGGLEPIPAVIRREAGFTWTGRHHRATQRQTTTHSLLRTILETPVNLTACFWTVGGNRRTRREPTHTRENMQPPHRKNQPGVEPGTLSLWANHRAAIWKKHLWKIPEVQLPRFKVLWNSCNVL